MRALAVGAGLAVVLAGCAGGDDTPLTACDTLDAAEIEAVTGSAAGDGEANAGGYTDYGDTCRWELDAGGLVSVVIVDADKSSDFEQQAAAGLGGLQPSTTPAGHSASVSEGGEIAFVTKGATTMMIAYANWEDANVAQQTLALADSAFEGL